jgi:hypothetical protein
VHCVAAEASKHFTLTVTSGKLSQSTAAAEKHTTSVVEDEELKSDDDSKVPGISGKNLKQGGKVEKIPHGKQRATKRDTDARKPLLIHSSVRHSLL